MSQESIMNTRKRVLANSAIKAALSKWAFTEQEVELLIGADLEMARSLGLDLSKEPGTRALSILIIDRILKSLVGDDEHNRLHWLTTENRAFGMSPKACMLKDPQAGLKAVQSYLERWEG